MTPDIRVRIVKGTPLRCPNILRWAELKKGDILSVPMWLAAVLVEDKIAELAE